MICEQALLARVAASAFMSPVEHRLERLLGLPLRVLRRQRLDAVERERELEVDRLLGPQRAVVVEDGDALGDRHEVRAALRRHARDEIGDGFLRRAVVPGRQRVGLRVRADAPSSKVPATTSASRTLSVEKWRP